MSSNFDIVDIDIRKIQNNYQLLQFKIMLSSCGRKVPISDLTFWNIWNIVNIDVLRCQN